MSKEMILALAAVAISSPLWVLDVEDKNEIQTLRRWISTDGRRLIVVVDRHHTEIDLFPANWDRVSDPDRWSSRW